MLKLNFFIVLWKIHAQCESGASNTFQKKLGRCNKRLEKLCHVKEEKKNTR